MLRIGDFSRLTQVSVRMLRHYDEMGLLKPAHIDHETGYRYYSASQIPRLMRILAFQDLGFSLRQIGHLLSRALSPDELRGMILQKQAELEDHLRVEEERLARAKARLRLIVDEGSGYDVIVRDVQPQWVASVRGTISAHSHIGSLFDRLFTHSELLRIRGLPAVIWHDDSYRETEIDAEAMICLPEKMDSVPAGIEVYQLPAALMACVVHQGAYDSLPAAYAALVRWLDTSGYQIAGAGREIYLHHDSTPGRDQESNVTEIQCPVTHLYP
jgi:DNA-binding transcriptional MerR regulator